MDAFEKMVNDHADAVNQRQQTYSRVVAARARNLSRHLTYAVIAMAIATVFLLFDALELAAPVLAVPVALIGCMVACYCMGRCVRFGKRVR